MAISNKKGTTWYLTQLEICGTSDLSHCCTIHAVFSAFPLKMHYWDKKFGHNKETEHLILRKKVNLISVCGSQNAV